MRIVFALLFCLLSAASPTLAGDMQICNRSSNPIEYAMIWDEGIPVFADIWKARGWDKLEPSACVMALRSSARQELYLSVRRINPDGSRKFVEFGYDDEPCQFCEKELLGIEEFYCVAKGDFERTEEELKDHQTCPSGYHGQLFNLFAFSAVSSNLTINIVD